MAPILQKLILNREPEKVLKWADEVAKWSIKRIIPCHLENDVKTNSKEFRRAFNFLETAGEKTTGFFSMFGEEGDCSGSTGEKKPRGERPAPVGLAGDVSLLSETSIALTKQGVLFPEAELIRR